MKRCPTCNQTFDDDALSYCLNDGTSLVSEISSVPTVELQATMTSRGSTGFRMQSRKASLTNGVAVPVLAISIFAKKALFTGAHSSVAIPARRWKNTR